MSDDHEEIPNRELTANERAALLLHLGILLEQISGNDELGLDTQVAIVRYLFPDVKYETAMAKLREMSVELDDIRQLIFDKDPTTQTWQLAIVWNKDAMPK